MPGPNNAGNASSVRTLLVLLWLLPWLNSAYGAAPDGARLEDIVQLAVRVNKHVVRVGDEIVLTEIAKARQPFVVRGVVYAVRRMAFFHRSLGRVVHIDGKPEDVMPNLKSDGLAPGTGSPILTYKSGDVPSRKVRTNACSPGIFIITVEWSVNFPSASLPSGKLTKVFGNPVLVIVEASKQWREADHSEDPSNEQELLEQLFPNGNE